MRFDVLRSILQYSDLDREWENQVQITGDDPVFQTPFRIASTSAASLAAIGLMLSSIRERSTGQKSGIEVNARFAAASMRSSRYIRVDGKPGRNPPDSVTGFYKVANDRWNYFHANFPRHQAAILRVLGVAADRTQVAEACLKWNSIDLETAVDLEGGCAPAVRTLEEWNALENTATLKQEPLIDIRKIGDCPPIRIASTERPLAGVRTLDLTRVLAGPTCARLLAEYGADVLKITCAEHPDSASNETDTGYGKRKLTLNIASEPGRAQFENLIRNADIFCQAYRKDAMSNLGYSAERVAELRPGIIYTSLNAFGHRGTWRGRRGFDTVIQSASGMAHIQGKGKAPQLTPVSALDYLSGYLMMFGTLVALQRRADLGGSYAVNVSLARVREWLVDQGLIDQAAIDATPTDLSEQEVGKLLIDVPSPIGRLTRLCPLITFSDGTCSNLLPWTTNTASGPTWL